jgi:hypothetical protein
MSTNSIFILKPIWDALYEDAKKDRDEMDALKRRISECDEERVTQLHKEIEMLNQKVYALELENATLKSCTFYNVNDDAIDDVTYAAEANAPAHTYVDEKEVNDVVVPIVEEAKDTKIVKMVGEKTKKEYQREYQRAYRKKQKNMTMNV